MREILLENNIATKDRGYSLFEDFMDSLEQVFLQRMITTR